MKKTLYSLLALLMFTLGSATGFADAPDWAKNKAISTVSEAKTGTITEGEYILYQAGSSWNKYLKEGTTLGAQLLAVSKPDTAPDDVAYVVHIAPTSDNSSYFTIQLASGNYIGQFTFSGWGDAVVSSATAGTFTIEEVSGASGYYNIKSTANDYWLNINSSGPVTWTAGASDASSNSAYQILPVTLSEGSYAYYSVSYSLKNSSGTALYTSPTYIVNDGAEMPFTVPATIDGFYEITGDVPPTTVTADASYELTFAQQSGDIPMISTSASADDATWYGIKARESRPLIALSQSAQSGIFCNPFSSYKITSMFQSAKTALTYDDVKNAQLWCITGDPINGFRFINKWNKAAIAVGSSSAAGQNAVMRLVTTNSYSLFDITKTTAGYQAQVHGGTQYLSDWGGDDYENLKFYGTGAAGDPGSALTFVAETDITNIITTSNIEAAEVNSNHGWVGDTYATITVPESTTNTGEALFNEVYSTSTVAIESGKYYKIRLNRSEVTYDASKYFWWSSASCTFPTDGDIQNNYDGYERGIYRVAEASAEVPKLFVFETVDATAGTYKIKNANANLYLCDFSQMSYNNIDLPVSSASAGTYTLVKATGGLQSGTASNEQWNIAYINGSTSKYINATNGVNYTTISDWNGNSQSDGGNNWSIIPVEEIPLTIYSDTQYASVCYPFGITLPSTLQAYIATAAASNSASTEEGKTGEVTLSSIGTSVPKNTPVIIGLADGATAITADTEYTLTINDDATATTTGNILTGATVSRKTFDEGSIYVLTTDGSAAVMRPNTSYSTTDEDGNDVTTYISTIPANRAYLEKSEIKFTDGSNSVNGLYFNFGETTGIHAVSTQTTDEGADTYYDLNGRRVLYPAHGVFVKGNGQKVFIK